MAVYTSDVNRVTGLSGIDTESMIEQLMSSESYKYENYLREQTYTEWEQEAYREIASMLQDFEDEWLGTSISSNLGYEAAWNNFITSVTDKYGEASNIVKVSGSSASGSYDIEIKQLATTESYTGNAVISGNLSTVTTVDEIKATIAEKGTISLNFSLDGVNQAVELTNEELNTTYGGNLEAYLEAELSVFGTASNGDPKVGVTVGDDNKITFSPQGGSTLTITNGNSLTQDVSITQEGILDTTVGGTYEMQVEVDGRTFNITAEFTAGETVTERLQKIEAGFASATLEGTYNTTTDLTTMMSLQFSYDGNDFTITNTSNTDNYDVNSASFVQTDGTVVDLGSDATGALDSSNNLAAFGLNTAVSTNVTGTTSLVDAFGEKFTDFLSDPANLNDDDYFEMQFGSSVITIGENDTVNSIISKINNSDAPFQVSFNDVTGRFKIESKTDGLGGALDLSDEEYAEEKAFISQFLGIDLDNKENNASYTAGQNSIIEIDGVEVERDSNSINMNGLQMQLIATGSVTVSAEQDVDATFDKIQEFVEAYNSLVTTLEAAVNESRKKDSSGSYYEPLLDEEKAVLSDAEVTKLEDAAKEGILYNDEYVTKILSDLRSMIYEPVDLGGGLTISLYDIGITTTSDYNTGKLTIDEDKLKTAIAERSEDISALFTSSGGIADQLDALIDKQIGTSGYLRTKAGIENTTSVASNLLSDELSDLADRIAAEKERLYNKEMSYYSMFSSMEAVINQQNAQMSMLLSSLG